MNRGSIRRNRDTVVNKYLEGRSDWGKTFELLRG